MAASAVILLAAVLGADAQANVEVGWRPLPGGGMQYLIQLDPLTVEVLRTGQAIESYIPPQVKDVRGFQIGIGTGKLPRIDPPTTALANGPKSTEFAGSTTKAGSGRPQSLGGFGSSGPAFSASRSSRSESPVTATPPGSKAAPWEIEKPSGAGKDDSPRPLPANLSTRPFSGDAGQKPTPGRASAATFEQWTGGKEGADNKENPAKVGTQASAAPGDSIPARPWTALTLALAGLFGSLGGNVYLGWLLVETRRRYRAALRRLKRVETEEWDAPPSQDAYRSAHPADSPGDP